MTEIIPGIHRLVLPMPADSSLGHVNVYLMPGDGQCLLVDTGWNTDQAFAALQEQMAAIGVRPADITGIIITHIHPDHYGLAGRLKKLSPARLAMHRLEKANIRARYIDMDELLQQIERWLRLNGAPPDELPHLGGASVGVRQFVAPAQPDTLLEDGQTVTSGKFRFRVIWTPGHSRGHLALYEPEQKILISGDHILPRITPNIGLHPQSTANPLDDYLKSLARLKTLPVDRVLPGHEIPFTGLARRITELEEHHLQRHREILAALEHQPRTAYQIATEITWASDTGRRPWAELSYLDRRLAVVEALAHLEFLRQEGRLDKSTRNDVVYYRRNLSD
ncbi:MAG: MBL fold metallo-hydrolase [Chloroflexota bacterium]